MNQYIYETFKEFYLEDVKYRDPVETWDSAYVLSGGVAVCGLVSIVSGVLYSCLRPRRVEHQPIQPMEAVTRGEPKHGDMKIWYKFSTGACTPDDIQSEIKEDVKDKKLIRIYSDKNLNNVSNRQKRTPLDVTCSVGAILEEENSVTRDELLEKLRGKKYNYVLLPDLRDVTHCLFPNVPGAIEQGYEDINNWLEEDKATSGPFIVVYQEDGIYMLKPVRNKPEYYFDPADRDAQTFIVDV